MVTSKKGQEIKDEVLSYLTTMITISGGAFDRQDIEKESLGKTLDLCSNGFVLIPYCIHLSPEANELISDNLKLKMKSVKSMVKEDDYE